MDLIEEADMNGYHYPRSGDVIASALDADEAACRESTCKKCEHIGLNFEPRVNAAGSYVPFCVCPQCGRQ